MAQNLILDKENNIWTSSNSNGIFKINRDILKYKTIGRDEFDGEGNITISSGRRAAAIKGIINKAKRGKP